MEMIDDLIYQTNFWLTILNNIRPKRVVVMNELFNQVDRILAKPDVGKLVLRVSFAFLFLIHGIHKGYGERERKGRREGGREERKVKGEEK